MPTFKDLGLQAPLKGQNVVNIDVHGLKVPNFKELLPEMRNEGLLGAHPDRLEMSSQGPMNAMVRHGAAQVNGTSRQQPKASLAVSDKISGQRKRDKQGPAKKHHRELITDTHRDKSSFGPPGLKRSDYSCNRASGLSAGLKNQESTRSKNDTNAEVCCVCLETYSWGDLKVFTKCCEIAIGSHCKAQNLADFGECWNCGEEETQDRATSEAGSWLGYDPKDFANETPPIPLYAALLPSHNDGRKSATVKVKADNVLLSGSTIRGQGSNTRSTNTRESEPSEIAQSLIQGVTGEQCDREAVMHQSRARTESSTKVSATSKSSPNVDNGYTKSYATISKANTAPSESQRLLYNGSETPSSDLLPRDQQHVRSVTSKTQRQQEAKHYVIEATKHLIEVCDVYGDVIDDEITSAILEAIGGCKTFQIAVDKQILGNSSTRTTQPLSAQGSATVDVSNLESGDEETYCAKCEELDFRMKKAADALLGM